MTFKVSRIRVVCLEWNNMQKAICNRLTAKYSKHLLKVIDHKDY